MLSPVPVSSTDTRAQLAIPGLPVELIRLRMASMYWITLPSHELQSILVRQLLNGTTDTVRGVLASAHDPAQYMHGLARQPGRDIRLFKLGRKTPQTLDTLTKELDRALRPKERIIWLCLPESHTPTDPGLLAAMLERWAGWLAVNLCTLLVLDCSTNPQAHARTLLPLNNALSGLACLTPEKDATFSYHIEHWRSELGVKGAQQFTLRLEQDRLVATGSVNARETRPARAESVYLFEKAALRDPTLRPSPDWLLFDTRQALYEYALTASTATVVFALQTLGDLPEIARMFHALRQQRGPSLKLVLIEGDTPLRHLDEQRILACGATLVIHAGTTLPRLLNMLEEIQPLTYGRELVADPGTLFESASPSRARGTVSAGQFIDYLGSLLEIPDANIPGVLISLEPVPGLSARQTLLELNLKRFDDIACTLGQRLHLFLYGCHPHMVGAALENMFKLPYQELFTHHSELFTREEIEAEYQRLCLQANDLSDALGEDPEPGTGGRPPRSDVISLPDTEKIVRYRPERLTLSITARTKH